jgi:tRNA pseudouridine-54 N-methylase
MLMHSYRIPGRHLNPDERNLSILKLRALAFQTLTRGQTRSTITSGMSRPVLAWYLS